MKQTVVKILGSEVGSYDVSRSIPVYPLFRVDRSAVPGFPVGPGNRRIHMDQRLGADFLYPFAYSAGGAGHWHPHDTLLAGKGRSRKPDGQVPQGNAP